MYVLAIETATESCSVALWRDGEIVQRAERAAAQRHAELLLDQVQEVLAEAEIPAGALDFIGVGRGPGAFTGVRLGVGVAQGLGFSLDRPVIPVSTLAALALAGFDTGSEEVLALLDARRGEVYWALFRSLDAVNFFANAAGECISPVEAFSVPWTSPRRLAVGPGLLALPDSGQGLEIPAERRFPDVLPDAGRVARLAARAALAGGGVSAEAAQPVYLRNQVADPAARSP